MKQSINSKDYVFCRFHFARTRYTDNRAGLCPHYFGYMRSGTARLVCETRELHVEQGDLFYIPRGCAYQSFWTGAPDIIFDSLSFASFLHEEPGVTYPLQRISMTPTVAERYFALTEGDMTLSYDAVGRFFLFLDSVLPLMERQELGHGRAVVSRALSCMQDMQSFSVPLLARACRVSESGLYAAFRQEEGCTPLSAWQRIQAARAVSLLRTTDLPIEAIAERLGYCSATYFRAVLRRTLGKTPRQIRREGAI